MTAWSRAAPEATNDDELEGERGYSGHGVSTQSQKSLYQGLLLHVPNLNPRHSALDKIHTYSREIVRVSLGPAHYGNQWKEG